MPLAYELNESRLRSTRYTPSCCIGVPGFDCEVVNGNRKCSFREVLVEIGVESVAFLNLGPGLVYSLTFSLITKFGDEVNECLPLEI